MLGPAIGTSTAGVTGGGAATGATEDVATGCVHCIGVVVAVAGLAAALGAAEGLEVTSGDVASGESRVAERGFLPRLAVEEGVGRGLALVEGELLGFGGMSWKEDMGRAEKGQVEPCLKASVMARSLSTLSPSPGPRSPSFSDDSSSQDGAPSNFTDFHDPAQPATSRPGSPSQPANVRPPLDIVTCQWEDCGDAFDDLNTFIRHLHEGAPDFFPPAWLPPSAGAP